MLKPVVLVGVNVTVTLVGTAKTLTALPGLAIVTPKRFKLGVTSGTVPMVVESMTALDDIVAAAIFVCAICGALGLMMLLNVNDTAWAETTVPAVNGTVNTLPAKVGVPATGVLSMPVILPTTMVAVDVNPVSVTTTFAKVPAVTGVNEMVTNPLLLVAAFAGAAEANATAKRLKLGVIAGVVPETVLSKRLLAALYVAAATFVSPAPTAVGLMMLVHVKDTTEPAVGVPAEKVTVNTPPVRVGAEVVAPLGKLA